jgi:sec-independent protein translocase protein TatA
MFGLSFPELAIVALVAVLLFGKNLPSVMKSFGKQYRQLRQSMSDLQSQMDPITKEFYDISNPTTSSRSSKPARKVYDDYDDRDEVSAPKFEPPPAEPQVENRSHEAA